MLLPSHAQLHIGPTATDGAVRIQLNFSPAYVYFDMLDYTPAFSRAPGPYPAAGRDRARIPVGDTRLSNNELMDPSAAGDGILKNILNDENGRFRQGYVQGQADCFTLVDELINSPNTYLGHGVRANPLYDHLFDSYEEYNRLRFENDPMQRIIIPDIGLRHRQAMSSNVNHRNVVTDWNNLAGRSPPASPPAGQPPPQHPVSQGEAAAQQLEDARSSSAFPIEVDLSYDLYEDPYSPFESELQSMADESTPELDSPRAMMQEGRVSPFSEPETQWPEYCERSLVPRAGCAGKGGQGPFDMTLARVNGARSMIVMSTQAAAQAAGIAGVALGAAFVILDFVEGNWKGAAIGAASLILGTAAVLAADGPIGWLLGGLITAFFAILPKLFGGHKAAQPYNNNITQIIQYQMFGDAKHTGNEQCQKTNPNCTAVYGPGVIAVSYEWEYFDAVAFLINFNDGYPMTIPDMANAFTFNKGSAAMVHCDGPRQNANAWSSFSDLEDPNVCYNPKMSLNRDLIELPNINRTATEVYSRIIPNTAGDCRLIDNASNSLFLSNYNFTVTGLPVSIACNITPAIDINGTTIPLGAPSQPSNLPLSSTNNTNTIPPISPGNASTNNQPGAYIAPPPATPFVTPFNATNSICFSSASTPNSICFPNGTYTSQTGLYGSNTSTLTSMTIPPSASLSISWLEGQTVRGGGHSRTSTFNASMNATADPGWASVWKIFNNQLNNPHMSVFAPSPPLPPLPPTTCLFSSPKFVGQVFCLGLGGGNLTGGQRDSVQSVKVFGGARVYLFADSGYADGSETLVTMDVEDLTSLPFGRDENLAGRVKGVWVAGGSE
ncbi:hypothetical protein MMC21_003171 [Puttea exsequens]|nr:hypothetical protein [Puttea exsequens]